MRKMLSLLPKRTKNKRMRRKLAVESLEHRVTPAGNLLVTTSIGSTSPVPQVLREYTPNGVQLRQVSIGSGDEARDIAVSDNGDIHVYYGTFGPALDTYSKATSSWSPRYFAGWSTVNNLTYGGLAYYGGYIYATDMTTYGSTTEQLKGIVRFDLANNTAQRFADTIEPIDLNIGLDNKLYAINGYRNLYVFDPTTMTQLNEIVLPWSTPGTLAGIADDYRGVAADASGNIYLATWAGQIHRFGPDGTYQTTLTLSNYGLPNYGLWDIDVDTDGELVFSGGSTVFRSTTALNSITGYFGIGRDGFVTFAKSAASPPPPVPTINVNDAAVVEGASGQQLSMFMTVSLSNVYTSPVTVAYATGDGTATLANNDYVSTSGTLTFAPGETSKVVTVKAVGDSVDEHNETFRLNLSNPTNASLGTGFGTATIADDDPAPTSKVAPILAAAYMRDYDGDGVFTEQLSAANGFSVRRFDFTGSQTIPEDERAVLEFDIGSFSPNDITGATLQLSTLSGTSNTTAVEVYGYAADGVADLADATRPAYLLGSFRPTGPSSWSIPLDLANLLKALPAGTTRFGIRLSGIAPTNAGFYGTSSGATAPKLTFQVSVSPPYMRVDDITVNEGDYATFSLSVDRPIGTSVAISYNTVQGTATHNVDYIYTFGSVTFGPNDLSKTIVVPTVGDAIDDSGEQFELSIFSQVSSSTLTIADNRGQATLVDVPNPSPGMRIDDISVTEGNAGATTGTFTVTLSIPSQNTVTVDYATANNSAIAPDDYITTSGSLTFLPGETSKTIDVQVIGDTIYENTGAAQQFRVNLSNLVNGTMLDGVGTCSIIEDELKPSIVVDDTTVIEGNSGNTTATVTIRMSGPTDGNILLNYGTSNGTAQFDADYQTKSSQVWLTPGQTTQTVSFNVFGDIFTEGNETVNFAISQQQSTYATITDPNAVVTIVDDDPTSGTMAVTSRSAAYGEDTGPNGVFDALYLNNFSIVIRRVTGLEDRAMYEFDVSPIIESDVTWVAFEFGTSSYTSNSGPVEVYGFVGDGIVQLSDATQTAYLLGTYQPNSLGRKSIVLNREMVLALAANSNYLGLRLQGAASAPHVNTSVYAHGAGPSNAPALVFHTDPPIVPQVSVNDGSALEGNPSEANTSITFTVSLDQPTTVPVSVAYSTADGTASSATDYDAASGTLTFAPGETSRTVTVNLNRDIAYEADETFALNLLSPNGVTIADGQGIGTIRNDDTPPTISATAASVQEGNAGTTAMTFTVTLSTPSGLPVSVNYTTQDDTATAGSDYSSTSGTVTVAPGQTQATFTIDVAGDASRELDERFFVNFSNPVYGTLGTTQVTGTIVNDDDIPSISVDSPSAAEGDVGSTNLAFTVTLSTPSTDPISVDYATANGSANSQDYASTSGTLTFAPGETSKTIEVAVTGETDLEADETLTLTLSNAVNATIGTGIGTGTIVNDDYAPVADAGPDQNVVENTTVGFDGSNSSDADGDLLSYSWDFGDGGTGSGATAQHRYLDSGSYTVTLTVTDGHGGVATDSATINVANLSPSATGVSGPTTLSEGDSATYVLTGVGDPSPVDEASLHYSFAFTTGGLATNYNSASASNSFNHLFAKDGFFTVYARVYDKDGAVSGVQQVSVNVGNVLPVVSAAGDTAINEGGAFAGSGSFTDSGADTWSATVDYGDGGGQEPLTLNPDKTFSLGHVYTDNGNYTITVRVADDDGVGTKSLALVVNSVAPTAAITGASRGVRGQSLGFTFSATDPSSADMAKPFTYTINWGDGAETLTGPASLGNRSHVYATAGTFTISVTATDKDGVVGAATTKSVVIVAAEVQGDTLFVGGTNAAERITLKPSDTTGGVNVVVAGSNLGNFRPSDRIVVYGLDGNDTIELLSSRIGNKTYSIGLRSVLDGGSGNDLVDARGSTGDNVLVGGAGGDTQYGGSGRDILVGGLGADLLRGGDDEDILIGGSSDFDNDLAAWDVIVDEWSRTDASYGTRIDHLFGTLSGGLNQVLGSYKYLNGTTLDNDSVADDLYGEGNNDWFIAWSGDRVNDRKNGERLTNLL